MDVIAQALKITPRDLTFLPYKHDTLVAGAVWDQLGLGASYEVSPLIGGDNDEPYAWQALLYPNNIGVSARDVDPACDEYATKEDAIAACQWHNHEKCIKIIEEMVQ